MKRNEIRQMDNRDAAEMFDYMEARIDALKRRILQLEAENEALRWTQGADGDAECHVAYAASA